jgi:hippurate hydrolase
MVTQEMDALLSTYKHLHSHPELSYYEKETAAYVASALRELGFEVTEKVGDYGVPGRTSYGLVAVLENGPGPTVMVRTDLDALPVVENTGVPYASTVTTELNGDRVGVMHACGHDLHMTSFLGTARLLSQLRDEWSGTLVLIGQPAEERGSGAKAMLDGGLYTSFPKPDYAVALHTNAAMPAGTVGYREGYALANVDSVDITIRGAGGHGAYPHTTKDPIVIAAEVVLALQTIVSREVAPIDPAVVTVGSFHGGTKHNIIPDEAQLQLTVRSYKPEVRKQVLDAIERITKGIAVAAGIPEERAPIVKIAREEFTPSTYNDPELAGRVVPVLEAALGSDNVIRVDPVMGGEDFSRYGLDTGVPIFMFWLGAVDPVRYREAREQGLTLPSLHSSEFAPLPEPAIRIGVTATTAAVLELLGK